MNFERTRGPAKDRRDKSLLADPARLELLDLAMVRSLTSTSAIKFSEGAANWTARLLEQVLLLRELASRTGRASLLAKAAATAERVARGADPGSRLEAAALLQQATCALEAAQLFADPNGAAAAKGWLAKAEEALGFAPGRLNGPGLIRARLIAADALAGGDRGAMIAALAAFDDAVATLDARLRATGAGRADFALAGCERADLTIGMAARLKDVGLLHRTVRDLESLSALLDPAYLPLSLARAETLRGSALRAIGEATAEARLMKTAATAFRSALNAVPVGHSPLDRARAADGLGLALQGMAELADDTSLYRSAMLAFDRALGELQSRELPLRSIVAHNRAVCLARQAERGGDVRALADAEFAFKAELAEGSAAADPVAWAVVQISLARIYEARADLLGDAGERADAAFALTQALDVFAERGLKTLSEAAATALARVRRWLPDRI